MRTESVKKIVYTVGIVGLYILLCHIPLPFMDTSLIYVKTPKSDEIFSMFLGAGVEKFSMMSLGIMPYTTATIIMQMLSSNSLGVDAFRALKNNYNTGITQLNNWTKRLTIVVAMIHGAYAIFNLSVLMVNGVLLVHGNTLLFCFVGVVLTIAGSLIAVWLSNLISKKGVGNGISVIIFVNIISNSASHFTDIITSFMNGVVSLGQMGLVTFFQLVVFVIIVFTEDCFYKMKVQNLGSYYTNDQEYLRIKLNNSGIMPIIIASYLSYIPQVLEVLIRSTKLFFVDTLTYIVSFISPNTTFYFVFISFLIVLVTLNYSEISLDPKEISRQIQQNNVVILSKYKNIRPGKDTEIYIQEIVSHWPSAIIITFIFVGSQIFCHIFNLSVGVSLLSISGVSVLLAVTTAKSIFNTAISYNYSPLLNKYKCHDAEAVENEVSESYMRDIQD